MKKTTFALIFSLGVYALVTEPSWAQAPDGYSSEAEVGFPFSRFPTKWALLLSKHWSQIENIASQGHIKRLGVEDFHHMLETMILARKAEVYPQPAYIPLDDPFFQKWAALTTDDIELVHQNETYFGDSAEIELATIRMAALIVRYIADLQIVRAAKEGRYTLAGRGFHQKGYAVLARYEPDFRHLPTEFQQGFFDPQNLRDKDVYAILRFSNGISAARHDIFPDVRGIGIVWMIVDRKSQEIETVFHWPGTHGGSLTANSVDTFSNFGFTEARNRPLVRMWRVLKFLLKNSDVRSRLITATFPPAVHPLRLTYSMGHAGYLGKDVEGRDRAFKWALGRPAEIDARWFGPLDILTTVRSDFLNRNLRRRAKKGFTLPIAIQVEQKDDAGMTSYATPVNAPGKVWSMDEAPPKIVGSLRVFPQQYDGYAQWLDRVAQNIAIHPQNTAWGQVPLDPAGRARSIVYELAGLHRAAKSPERFIADYGDQIMERISHLQALDGAPPVEINEECVATFFH